MRFALIGYTVLTVVLWVVIGEHTPVGYVDKLTGVALVAMLLLEARRHA